MSGNMPQTRVLLVDDETNIRRLMADVLEKFGGGAYLVDTAEDGETALRLLGLKNYQCDVLLTDLQMPGISGEELMEAALAGRPELAVVIVTAYDNDDNALSCLRKGAVDYVVKPIEIKGFLAVIAAAAEVAAKQRSAPSMKAPNIETPLAGWLEITAPSDMEYVERFNRFVTRLKGLPLGPMEREDLRQAIHELGKNAVEWGNRGDIGKRLRLSYAVFDEQLVIKVEDEGAGFDPAGLPDPATEPELNMAKRLHDGKRPGGYGVALVRRLMDEVMFSENGNTVLMSKRLNRNE